MPHKPQGEFKTRINDLETKLSALLHKLNYIEKTIKDLEGLKGKVDENEKLNIHYRAQIDLLGKILSKGY